MYELCKFCKGIIDNYLPFRSILSGINTPAYELTNSFVLFSISNEYTVKYWFAIAKEIVDQDYQYFIGNLDVDSLFTNIPVEETIHICANTLKISMPSKIF